MSAYKAAEVEDDAMLAVVVNVFRGVDLVVGMACLRATRNAVFICGTQSMSSISNRELALIKAIEGPPMRDN